MTIARSKLVNPHVSRWYHCITRCVRQAFLLGEGVNRKQWLEDRLCDVASVFAISVGGFAILDNHLHFLLRLDPAAAAAWSAEEVVTRWAILHPPRRRRKVIAVTPEWLAEQIKDTKRVEILRARLVSLGWFMKEIKEPLARLANREDDCKGAFFEGRYKSIVLLDEQSILTVSAYIDLNAVASGTAVTPETSQFTSLNQRITHVRLAGRQDDLTKARQGSVAASEAACGLEDDLWLIPIEDRRRWGSHVEGMLEGFTLGNYLLLVDFMGRQQRDGKVALPAELEDPFQRLGISAAQWCERLDRLASAPLNGRFLSCSRHALRQASSQLGLHHCINLNGCLAV